MRGARGLQGSSRRDCTRLRVRSQGGSQFVAQRVSRGGTRRRGERLSAIKGSESLKGAMGTKESDPLKLDGNGNRSTRRARGYPEGAERRSDLSAGPSKTFQAWMERARAPLRGARPREQCSASSAMLRPLRVDLLLLVIEVIEGSAILIGPKLRRSNLSGGLSLDPRCLTP